MLSLWLHRIAFVPVLLAVVVAAFGFAERPRPIGTSLAPDAFSGEGAVAALPELERAGDRLPEAVAARLRTAGFDPAVRRDDDGARVVGERIGRDDRRLLVVAHVPAVAGGRPARAQLTGVAALVELARLFRGRATRRTLTLALAQDGADGRSALRALADRYRDGSGAPVAAVLVLGDLAGAPLRRPVVVPWSESGGAAPLRLRRTVEEAVRVEAGVDPGQPRALAQFARFAAPLTVGGQGPFGGAGLPAVLLSASGERPPPAAPVDAERVDGFGRAALRAIGALDNGEVPAGPREELVVARQVVPDWTVRLLAGTLLFPLVLAAVDGFARVRRRREPVQPWLGWLLAAAVPFLAAAVLARLLGLVGLLPAPGGAAAPEAVPAGIAGLVVVVLVLVLALAARPLLARRLGAPAERAAARPGPACVVALALAALGAVVWIVNPYTAIVLAPVLHLWLLAAAPEVRSRPLSLALVVAGAVPLVLLALFYAGRFGLDPLELGGLGVLLLSGGAAGPLGVLATSLLLGAGLGALLIALGKRRSPPEPEPAPPAPGTPRRTYSVLEPVPFR